MPAIIPRAAAHQPSALGYHQPQAKQTKAIQHAHRWLGATGSKGSWQGQRDRSWKTILNCAGLVSGSMKQSQPQRPLQTTQLPGQVREPFLRHRFCGPARPRIEQKEKNRQGHGQELRSLQERAEALGYLGGLWTQAPPGSLFRQPETSRVCHSDTGRADWTLSLELDLQDLCTEEEESQELEELWTSTYTFISLFLLSVSYSATVTVLKVCGCWTGWGPGQD